MRHAVAITAFTRPSNMPEEQAERGQIFDSCDLWPPKMRVEGSAIRIRLIGLLYIERAGLRVSAGPETNILYDHSLRFLLPRTRVCRKKICHSFTAKCLAMIPAVSNSM